MHITKSLLGMSVIVPDLVLVVLGNGDNCQDANDSNCNQQFQEREPCRILVGRMVLHDHPLNQELGTYLILCLLAETGKGGIIGYGCLGLKGVVGLELARHNDDVLKSLMQGVW